MSKLVCVLRLLTCLALCMMASSCAISTVSEMLPWSTKVVDKDTGKPVAEAVMERTWYRCRPHPIEGRDIVSITNQVDASDKNGKILSIKKDVQISVPFYWIETQATRFYKPGYQYLFVKDKPEVISLDRIPTIAEQRQWEAGIYYLPLREPADSLYGETVWYENDFIENDLKRPLPVRSIQLVDLEQKEEGSGVGKLFSFYVQQTGGVEFGGGRRALGIVELGLNNASSMDAEKLKTIIRKKGRSMRLLICDALGKEKDLHFKPILLDMFHNDSCDEVRQKALKWLRSSRGFLQPEDLESISDEKNCTIRIAACKVLGQRKEEQSAQILIGLLDNDACGDVRKAAVQALIKLDAIADSELVSAWTNGDMELRKQVEYIFATRNKGRDLRKLMDVFLDGDENDVIEISRLSNTFLQAVKKKWWAEQKFDEVFKKGMRSTDTAIRLEAVKQVGRKKSKRLIQPLMNIIRKSDEDAAIKEAAAHALVSIGSPSVIHLIEAAEIGSTKPIFWRMPSPPPSTRVQDAKIGGTKFRKNCQKILEELLDRQDSDRVVSRLKIYGVDDVLFIKQLKDLLPAESYSRVFNYYRAHLFDMNSPIQQLSAVRIGQFGEEGFNVLQEALSSDYSGTRKCAARVLGTHTDPRSFNLLLSLLKDKHPDVQCTAARALGRLNDPRAVAPLVNALKGDQQIRETVRETLINMDINDIGPLLVLLKSKDNKGKQEAVWVLGELQDSRAVKPIASLFVSSIDPLLKGEAVISLGKIKDPRAFPVLIYSIRKADDWPLLLSEITNSVALIAAEGGKTIQSFYRVRESNELLDLLQKEHSRFIVGAAIKVLGDLQDRRATNALLNVIKTPPYLSSDKLSARFAQRSLRRAAARSLGKIKDPASVEPLIEMLRDEKTVGSAAMALGDIGDPRAVEPLIAMQGKKNCANALGKIKDPRAIESLIEMLDKHKSSAAARALASFNDPRAKAVLVRAAKSENKDFAYQVVISLRKSDPQLAREVVAENLADANPVLRSNALYYIGRTKDPYFVSALIERVEKDLDAGLRAKAAQKLGRIGAEAAAATDVLEIASREDDDESVRRAARNALSKVRGGGTRRQFRKTRDGRIVSVESSEKSRKDPSSIQPLIDSWTSNGADLEEISSVLATMGPMAVEHLIPLLEHEFSRIRRKAAITLGRIGDARAVENLIITLDDDASEVRWSAAWALGRIGDSRAVDALSRFTEDSDIGIRRRAQISLREIQAAEKYRATAGSGQTALVWQ